MRWVFGDTTSGTSREERIHILVKPTRTNIVTNLVVNTDRRTYHMELRSGEETYMASVAWAYPEGKDRHPPPASTRRADHSTARRAPVPLCALRRLAAIEADGRVR